MSAAPESSSRRASLVSVLVVAGVSALASALWVTFVRSAPYSDYRAYWTAAESLAAGTGYRYLGHISAYWPPGYPLVLSVPFMVFGASMTVVKVLNVILHVAASVLAWSFARRIMGAGWALFAGLCVGVWPTLLFYTGVPASENLFIPLLMGCLLLLARWTQDPTATGRVAGGAGLLLGLAILTRVTAKALPFVFVLMLIAYGRDRRAMKAALLFGLGCALALAPWVVRNMVVSGHPVLTTNGGINLLIANNPEATGGYSIEGLAALPRAENIEDELLADKEYSRQALRHLAADPSSMIGLVPAKVRALLEPEWIVEGQTRPWFRPNDPVSEPAALWPGMESRLRFRGIRFEESLPWSRVALVILSVLAGVVALRKRDIAVAFPLVVVIYWLVLHISFGFGAPRYLVSIVPLMLLLAVYAAGAVIAPHLRKREAE